MKIVIKSITVVTDARRLTGLRAVASIRLDDAITINKCSLIETTEGYHVEPPRGRRLDKPVTWSKHGAFAQEVTDAMADAYEAMAAREPEQATTASASPAEVRSGHP